MTHYPDFWVTLPEGIDDTDTVCVTVTLWRRPRESDKSEMTPLYRRPPREDSMAGRIPAPRDGLHQRADGEAVGVVAHVPPNGGAGRVWRR